MVEKQQSCPRIPPPCSPSVHHVLHGVHGRPARTQTREQIPVDGGGRHLGVEARPEHVLPEPRPTRPLPASEDLVAGESLVGDARLLHWGELAMEGAVVGPPGLVRQIAIEGDAGLASGVVAVRREHLLGRANPLLLHASMRGLVRLLRLRGLSEEGRESNSVLVQLVVEAPSLLHVSGLSARCHGAQRRGGAAASRAAVEVEGSKRRRHASFGFPWAGAHRALVLFCVAARFRALAGATIAVRTSCELL
mmetsp:Transcript_31001/g.62913  ORF Transcript_31001/g.62913 Transcript_31001/m.62913 type:complete len:250 (-) Transcript_31001:212-961(-)